MPDSPDPVPNPMANNGILPGYDWPDNLLSISDDEGFFTDWIYPFDEAPLLTAIVDHAHRQWNDLFPDADHQDRMMFIAGLLTSAYWWSWRSITWRNQAMQQAEEMGQPMEAGEQVIITVDDIDEFIMLNTTRLASTVFSIEDHDEDDSVFEGIVEDF